jgi:hypothetical protein
MNELVKKHLTWQRQEFRNSIADQIINAVITVEHVTQERAQGIADGLRIAADIARTGTASATLCVNCQRELVTADAVDDDIDDETEAEKEEGE